jgi:hypothetical protein
MIVAEGREENRHPIVTIVTREVKPARPLVNRQSFFYNELAAGAANFLPLIYIKPSNEVQ